MEKYHRGLGNMNLFKAMQEQRNLYIISLRVDFEVELGVKAFLGVSRYGKQGPNNNEKLWEHGNTGQF